MLVQELIDAMERIAPLKHAESWDKVGLQLGVPSRAVGGAVLLSIDLTRPVLREAIEKKCGALVVYHPPIWEPLSALTDETHTMRLIRGAAEVGLAIFTPHTALDATPGGVTDWLCEGLSAPRGQAQEGIIKGDCRALVPSSGGDSSREVKVITFVPSEHVDQIRSALGTAGAGGIGNYRLCSFTTKGEGTFLPQDGATPSIGEVGSLERVNETKIEMVCARRALPLVIETLKSFHPYEEPAYDIVELVPEPLRLTGAGRRLVLDQPVTIGELVDRMKGHLDRSRMRYALAGDDTPVRTIGVCPGAGASLVETAKREGCDVFVTGEMTHHQILAARHMDMSVVLAGHTNTERGYLPRLAAKLGAQCPDTEFLVSEHDRDTITVA